MYGGTPGADVVVRAVSSWDRVTEARSTATGRRAAVRANAGDENRDTPGSRGGHAARARGLSVPELRLTTAAAGRGGWAPGDATAVRATPCGPAPVFNPGDTPGPDQWLRIPANNGALGEGTLRERLTSSGPATRSLVPRRDPGQPGGMPARRRAAWLDASAAARRPMTAGSPGLDRRALG